MFGDDYEKDFSEEWKECIDIWIQQAIIEDNLNEVKSKLSTMIVNLESLKDSLQVDYLDKYMIEKVQEKLATLKEKSDEIKEKYEASSAPPVFMIPYDVALLLEVAGVYSLFATLEADDVEIDEDAQGLLKNIGNEYKSRFGEYKNYLEIIEDGSKMEAFKSSWEITSHPGHTCDWIPVINYCFGTESCSIDSSYLPRNFNYHCSLEMCGGSSCDGACNYKCANMLSKYKNGEKTAKNSVSNLFSSTYSMLNRVRDILGKWAPKPPTTTEKPKTTTPARHCAWVRGDSCYNYDMEEVSWPDAEDYCKDNFEGHLVAPSTEDEMMFLEGKLNQLVENDPDLRKRFWIGAKLDSHEHWYWGNGESWEWDYHAPDGEEGGRDRLYLFGQDDGEWHWHSNEHYEMYPIMCESK